ncbi:MAG: DEAD/DEAH box helicase, partial [Candidatus Eremiobacterota bacterium]
MTDNKIIFKSGNIIKNERFGKGRVELDKGETVIIRFEHGIEECDKKTLVEIFTPLEAIKEEKWHSQLEVITKAQAYSIRSVNESWGIFSLSRIALLPHQLWVCRQVISKWPTRYLIADDVGLGKTIEVGLILWPLLSNGRVKRLLILCPASLVQQWQYRLRTMFDIRLTQYCPEADSDKTDFWNIHSQVVASIQTLRMDRNNRHNRFLNSSPWDLIIVDESHHLNADEQTGHTLSYELLNRLVKDKRAASLLFLTGTPHRGKNYNFLALLKLLRPDLFDPRRPIQEQLPYLKQVMIRNNKQNVTDLHGHRLFHPPVVSEQTYKYSLEETKFYNMLTEFILTGKAYASSLASADARTVYLVLITMQKLASSSVAAIRKALKGRLEKIVEQKQKIEKLKRYQEQNPQKLYSEYEEMEILGDNDEISRIEQELLLLTAGINLMENEELRLRELIQAADEVKEETKINEIISIIKTRFSNRSVLFFTEYKATQSLLMSYLMKHFGKKCVTFI